MAYIKPKPIIRAETYATLQTAFSRILNAQYPFQNCLNCTHWDYGNDQCGKFKAKPPTDVIIYSCESYEDNDDIPF